MRATYFRKDGIFIATLGDPEQRAQLNPNPDS